MRCFSAIHCSEQTQRKRRHCTGRVRPHARGPGKYWRHLPTEWKLRFFFQKVARFVSMYLLWKKAAKRVWKLLNIPIVSGCRLVLAPTDLHSQTCTLRHLRFREWRHLQSFLFCSIYWFFFNLSTFYSSSQVVKTRTNKLNYNVTCNRDLHFPLPASNITCIGHESCALATETRRCGG